MHLIDAPGQLCGDFVDGAQPPSVAPSEISYVPTDPDNIGETTGMGKIEISISETAPNGRLDVTSPEFPSLMRLNGH